MKIFFPIIFLILFQSSYSQHYNTNGLTDGLILGIGFTTDYWLHSNFASNKILTEEEVHRLNNNNINILDRFAADNYSKSLSKISDFVLALNVTAPLALLLDDGLNGERTSYGIMYLENIMFASLAPGISKALVDRYRPYVYNPEVSFDHKQKKDSKSSFFSGHTTLAFASSVFLATTFQELHPDSKFTALVWTGSLITAATVGILRIESGKHFPTDVLTGAVVGSFVGYLVPHFHKNKKDNSSQIDRIEHIPILVIRFKF